MRLALRRSALPTAAALAVGAVFVPLATSVSAADTTANPSFEEVSNGQPACWQLGGTGTTTSALSSITGGRTGTRAGRVAVTRYTSGNAKLITSQKVASCGVPVTTGHSYLLGMYYKASAPVRLVVYYKTSAGTWTYWAQAATVAAVRSWTAASLSTPPVPTGAVALSYGMSMASTGTMTLDDASAIDMTRTPVPPAVATPTATASPAPTAPPLMSNTFTQPDGLVTNEYAHWDPTDPASVTSPDWDMTSGSLFANTGQGYSGTVDSSSPDATSSNGTNSAVLRLNTKRHDFGNVKVDMKLDVEQLTSTSLTPAVAWDGIHIWMRYKSQYNLYYASVARRDGSVVIKKKCVGGNDNGGTYYELTPEIGGHAIPFGQWRDVAATVHDNTDGSVTLSLLTDGVVLATATDRGVGCAPLTGTGAVGVRGDNAQFRMDDFTVTPD